MIYSLFLLIVVAFVHVDLTSANPSTDIAVHNSTTANIVGGTAVAKGIYPFYAVPRGDVTCGASLIHPDILLTAAHCSGAFATFDVYLGGIKIDGSDALETIRATTERLDPRYVNVNGGDYYRYDYMLVKLTRSVDSSKVPVVAWNTAKSNPTSGQSVKTIGFGSTFEGGLESNVLREVTVPVVNQTTCQRGLPDYGVDETSMICAGATGRDSCQFDAGGPLLDSSNQIIGVVSWGDGCGQADKPGVYSRVSEATDFIRRGICELSGVPPTSCGNPPIAGPPTVPVRPPTVAVRPPTSPGSPPTAADVCSSCRGLFSFKGVGVYKSIFFFGGACQERCSIFFRISRLSGWKCGKCPSN